MLEPRRPALGPIEDMTREDMAAILQPAYRQTVSPDRLRDSHHRVARLAASGLRNWEISQKTGYSLARVGQLLGAPAMQDLVAKYRGKVDAAWLAQVGDDYAIAVRSRQMALNQRYDRLEAADCGDIPPIPLKDLNAIIADTEDRYGVMKKSGNINLNADFAAELERAIARSGKVIEVVPEEGKLRRKA